MMLMSRVECGKGDQILEQSGADGDSEERHNGGQAEAGQG